MKIPAPLDKLMFDEPSVWVTATTVVTLMTALYLAFSEMFGKNLQYSKFTPTNPSTKRRRMKLSSRTGMLILYTPAFIAGLASFFIFPGGGLRLLLLKFAVTFHFFKRVLEVLFIHKYSGGMILNSTILISIVYLTAAAGMIIVQYLCVGLSEPSIDLIYIGLILFIIGIFGSFYHHILLSKLRSNEEEKEYTIPQGGLFNLIIYALTIYSRSLSLWGFRLSAKHHWLLPLLLVTPCI